MIKKRFLSDMVIDLKSDELLNELKDVNSQVIHDFGSLENYVDTIEESFRIHIENIRWGIKNV